MEEGIKDDLEFCRMLAEEESVIVLPGFAVGLNNWLRITFTVEPSNNNIYCRAFHQRHTKKQIVLGQYVMQFVDATTRWICRFNEAVAEFLSKDLPHKLSKEDIFITAGAGHAIELILTVLARPGANILLPRTGYPSYEAHSSFADLEVRLFDLVPEKDWEIDLDGVEALSDDNTVVRR